MTVLSKCCALKGCSEYMPKPRREDDLAQPNARRSACNPDAVKSSVTKHAHLTGETIHGFGRTPWLI